jgi:hypothetical protein
MRTSTPKQSLTKRNMRIYNKTVVRWQQLSYRFHSRLEFWRTTTMADWQQACCRKRRLRASQAPSKRPIPMAISRTRTTLASRGAAVSRNTAINRLSPRRLRLRSVRVQLRVSRGGVDRVHSGNWDGGAKIAHRYRPRNMFQGYRGDQTQSQKCDWNTVFRRNSSAPINTRSLWCRFRQSPGMQQILEMTRGPLAMDSVRSFSA